MFETKRNCGNVWKKRDIKSAVVLQGNERSGLAITHTQRFRSCVHIASFHGSRKTSDKYGMGLLMAAEYVLDVSVDMTCVCKSHMSLLQAA